MLLVNTDFLACSYKGSLYSTIMFPVNILTYFVVIHRERHKRKCAMHFRFLHTLLHNNAHSM